MGCGKSSPAARSDYQVVESEIFTVPYKYSDVAAHQANFFNSVRTRKTPVENQSFGNHAAIGCHLANYSYFKKTPAVWNADTKTIPAKHRSS